jgi:alpha-beta hydrolase superfamily lysophospholipase
LVLHAANDTMVDRSHAERNASWAKDAELVLYERGDHNSILAVNLEDIVTRVARFARQSAGG